MAENERFQAGNVTFSGNKSSNVKSFREYDRLGETIRYLTVQELQKLFDSIENYRHKLMLRMVYELGCRVGEFVRIQMKHLDFGRSAILFPADNTKTGRQRTSHLPRGVMNEVISHLRRQGRIGKRDFQVKKPESYLFHPLTSPNYPYSENRLRQVFRYYADNAGFYHQYGQDSLGRCLRRLTIHSLRHSHIMTYVHMHKLPLPIVQRQVGHKSLRSTSVYLNPSEEDVARAHEEVQRKPRAAAEGAEIYGDRWVYKS